MFDSALKGPWKQNVESLMTVQFISEDKQEEVGRLI